MKLRSHTVGQILEPKQNHISFIGPLMLRWLARATGHAVNASAAPDTAVPTPARG